MLDEYEEFNIGDRQNFRSIVHKLLTRTFLLRRKYDPEKNVKIFNPDYAFVERNFSLFSSYFDLAGFSLEKDDSYGVIKLKNDTDSLRPQKIDKATTLLIYALRLIYDEEMESLGVNEDVRISVSDLVNKLVSLGLYQKKPSDQLLADMLRRAQGFNLVYKASGSWTEASTRFAILPTIRFVLTNEKLQSLRNLVKKEEEVEEYENEEA